MDLDVNVEPPRSGPAYDVPSPTRGGPVRRATVADELSARPRVWTAGDAEPGPDLTHIVGDGGRMYRRTGLLWQDSDGTGPVWRWDQIPSYLRVEASYPEPSGGSAGVPPVALIRRRDGLRLAHPRRPASSGR